MKTEVISITHSNEGIRICWPDGDSTVFANPLWLAEAYAHVMRSREHVREALVGDIAEHLNKLKAAINDDKDAATLLEHEDKLRRELMGLVKVLS